MGRVVAEQYIVPVHVAAAINLYNDIRTTLEDEGWKRSHENDSYWWVHDDHQGTFSMSAAFRQVVLNQEKKKVQNR